MSCPLHYITPITTPMKNNINYFQKFIPKKDNENQSGLLTWSYSRVSSKQQESNNSLNNQIEANRDYARKNNLQITEEFGGTYESAKSDFTRKEFKRLIDKVTASRKKPYAILVYKMSRFSRSGGNAIGLVNTLVEELGVHLIEVCSGLTTTTERGKAAIYDSLFMAYKENLEKIELVVPAMQKFLNNGNWLGITPVGYDHYGPKVTNEKFLSKTQRIEINKDGELLREAWEWKLSGLYSDAQIMAKLAARGLHLTAQKISRIFRNPFYCAITINKLIDEPVQGNWPALISRETFIKVQNLLENNPSGYQHNKEEAQRPLTRLMKCNKCKHYMIGYINRKKNLHYYKCRNCKGVSVNALTTKKALRKGANDLFVDLLKKYSIARDVIPFIQTQLTLLFNRFNDSRSQNDSDLKLQLERLDKKVRDLKIRHGMQEIDKETYDLTMAHLNEHILQVSKELDEAIPIVSNLDKLLFHSLKKLENISEIWVSSNLDTKRRIQKTLFPEGIYYDAKTHECLTTKTNSFIGLTSVLAGEYTGKEKGNFQFKIENSLYVPGMGTLSNISSIFWTI